MFVTLTIIAEFYRGARVIAARDHSNILSAVGELTMRNTRRYGGYVVHFAMVMIFIGITGSAFNQDIQKEMNIGDKLTIGPYTILCQNFDQPSNDNYESRRATLEVFRNGHSQMMLYPERRVYRTSQVTQTDVAIESTAVQDLYVVYAGTSPDYEYPRHSRLSESTREMDLVRRHRARPRHDPGHDSRPPRSISPTRRNRSPMGRRHFPQPNRRDNQ